MGWSKDRTTIRGSVLLALLLAVGLILGGCAQEDPAIEGAPSGEERGEEAGDDHDDEMVDFGEPGDPAAADRTIEIDMLDALRFEPDAVDVQVGETVTFVLTNTGQIVHEFLIGDEHYQQDHAQEMTEMDDGMEHEELPNGLDVDPGETAELTWTFTTEGELLYGCHEPGHYEGGMVGTITVSS
ncbi:MAG: plastocyanin/azurin family copper-binding protein [Actinomycetota bacterium]